jgi:hypothetical protein
LGIKLIILRRLRRMQASVQSVAFHRGSPIFHTSSARRSPQ